MKSSAHIVFRVFALSLVMCSFAVVTSASEVLAQKMPHQVVLPEGDMAPVVRSLSGAEVQKLIAGKSFRATNVYYAGGFIEYFYQFEVDGRAFTSFVQAQYGGQTERTVHRWKVVGDKLEMQSIHQKSPIYFSIAIVENGKFVFLKPDGTLWLIEK